MDSDTPSPQDPARFSKPKSEPPILDLAADHVSSAPREDKTEDHEAPSSGRTPPPHDTVRVSQKRGSGLPVGGFVGGVIGGGIVALAFLGYTYVVDGTRDRIAQLESALGVKADQATVEKLESRVANLEAALGETQSAISSLAKPSPSSGADLGKRISALEDALRTNAGKSSPVATTRDPRALRLALVLSLRETLHNDGDVSREIAALDASGETGAAFLSLKANLSTPLVGYDELHAELVAKIKSAATEQNPEKEAQAAPSRVSSFFSQLVTVRPANTVTPKISATDISFTPLLDAIDENDPNAALIALAALPQSERDQFKSIATELKRRADVDEALRKLFDATLDAIVSGDAK